MAHRRNRIATDTNNVETYNEGISQICSCYLITITGDSLMTYLPSRLEPQSCIYSVYTVYIYVLHGVLLDTSHHPFSAANNTVR